MSSLLTEIAKLQWAGTSVAMGLYSKDADLFSAGIRQIESSLTLIKEQTMAKDGKNYTSKPVADGTKIPQNNQGVPPNPEQGLTTGKGNEADDSGKKGEE